MVGQRETAALGILSSVLLSLAAQYSPVALAGSRAAKFYILDGGRGEGELAGCFTRLADAVPHSVTVAASREASRVLAEIAAEVERRGSEDDADAPTICLLVYDLGRFRDLRREEHDLGFGRRGEDDAASPVQNVLKIVRDGAAVGVHTLVWCDTATALNRVFDRQTLREFEQRIVFQMSGDDSSNLIDSPVATKLGPYRALFHSEETGSLEKFRPYDLPRADWLAQVKLRFAARRDASRPRARRE